MEYTSTRNKNIRVSAAQAIAQGISEDGGLFVPVSVPAVSMDEIIELSHADYITRAKKILSLYLTDFTDEELDYCVNGAYEASKFSSPKIAPLVEVEPNTHVLELWRGPTCAFKDMALQILPYLLTVAASKTAGGKEIVILVATSGDTGKAALEGFKDVKSTKVLVFYPEDGVSPMQKLQMMTQEGENVGVCAIKGNFDDAQSGVKKIFTDPAVREKLAAHNMMFSSANSINWGRLVPQVVYYFSAYCDMISDGSIEPGKEINVVVPTGNFGNILAAYYAKKMGLPIKKLICASNANNVLTDFLTSGTYDRNRDFYMTASPSMDILISSNLERLLYHLSGDDGEQIKALMEDLDGKKVYEVSDKIKEGLKVFYGGFATVEETNETIGKVYKEAGYLMDTHTAVAYKVYEDYKNATGDKIPAVIASTASPYKFADSVAKAIGLAECKDGFEYVREVNEATGVPVPSGLKNLDKKPVLHTGVLDIDQMAQAVKDCL